MLHYVCIKNFFFALKSLIFIFFEFIHSKAIEWKILFCLVTRQYVNGKSVNI